MLHLGTGLDAPPAGAALGCAEELVLVTDRDTDTNSVVCEAAEWLEDRPCRSCSRSTSSTRLRGRTSARGRSKIAFARGLIVSPQAAVLSKLLASRFSHGAKRPPTGAPCAAALLATD